MIEDVMRRAIAKKLACGGARPTPSPEPAQPLGKGVPTMKPGVHRKFSPMLRARFERHGRWERATHGTWLSLADMEALWSDDLADRFLSEVRLQVDALKEDWPNHALALFKEERLSLFAASDLNNEAMLLLWLDFEAEPEVWVYDADGESRYRNLEAYLDAYLADDVSAAQRSWRA